MQTFKRKTGDTGPDIETCLYAGAEPYDLTLASVRLVALRASTGVASSLAASVESATAGRVRANISSLLATADMFDCEWEITDGGEVYTVPNERPADRLIVISDAD